MCLRKNTAIIQLKAISYRIPMPIIQVVKSYDGFFDSLCPRCHSILPYEYIRYCPLCGQRLCWLLLDVAEELDSAYSSPNLRKCLFHITKYR